MDVPVGVASGVRIPCWLCGDLLHEVADARLDEFTWVDEAGGRIGGSPDLRPLGGVEGAYARLRWLASECDRLSKLSRKTKDGYRWPGEQTRAEYLACGREYSALNERLRWPTFHHHQVRAADKPSETGPVPCCCGWPAWLRPSGWYCRKCKQRCLTDSWPVSPA